MGTNSIQTWTSPTIDALEYHWPHTIWVVDYWNQWKKLICFAMFEIKVAISVVHNYINYWFYKTIKK